MVLKNEYHTIILITAITLGGDSLVSVLFATTHVL